MGARLLAIFVAIALVTGGFAWRYRDGGSLRMPTFAGGEKARLVCTTELADVCNGLAGDDITVTVEPAGTTADRLGASAVTPESADIDGWLAPRSWIQIVRDKRTREGSVELLKAPGPVIARTPIVVVSARMRLDLISSTCPSALVTWRCLGDFMGKGTWLTAVGPGSSTPAPTSTPLRQMGDIKVGLPDPSASAVGMAGVSSLTLGYFGRAEIDAADVDDAAGYGPWIAAASRGVAPNALGNDALATMLTAGPGLYDTVVTTESHAALTLEKAAQSASFRSAYPTPTATLDVSLATIGSQKRLSKTVQSKKAADAFAQARWRVPKRAVPRGADASVQLAETAIELPPGTQEKLRIKWRQELSR